MVVRMFDTARGSVTRDARIIGLVGSAHFFSHFFQLALPPLFPVLKDALGVPYVALGFMMSVMYAASGVGQTVSGFLVDRFGAARVLVVGMTLFAGRDRRGRPRPFLLGAPAYRGGGGAGQQRVPSRRLLHLQRVGGRAPARPRLQRALDLRQSRLDGGARRHRDAGRAHLVAHRARHGGRHRRRRRAPAVHPGSHARRRSARGGAPRGGGARRPRPPTSGSSWWRRCWPPSRTSPSSRHR